MPRLTDEQLKSRERLRLDERRAALNAVAYALTEAERQHFLAAASQMWRRMAGAHVNDVLDMTSDYDMFLNQTEPFFEAHGGELPDSPGLIFAAHVLLILGRPLTVAGVLALLVKAGLADGPAERRASGPVHDGDREAAERVMMFAGHVEDMDEDEKIYLLGVLASTVLRLLGDDGNG